MHYKLLLLVLLLLLLVLLLLLLFSMQTMDSNDWQWAAQSVEAARMEEGAACNDASAAPGAACNDASAAPRIFEAKQCFFLSKYFSESQPRLRTTIHHYCHALSLHPGPLCSPARHTIAVSAPMSATRRCGRSCTSGHCGSGQHVFEHELWPC